MSDLQVGRNLTIPASELRVRFTTSGGPGGQHANRSSTKVTLAWNIEDSAVLSARQRSALRKHLRHRITDDGEIQVAADDHRSQLMNRKEAERRLAGLVASALRPRKTRRPTAPTKASKDRRIQAKKRRSEIKRLRGRDFDV